MIPINIEANEIPEVFFIPDERHMDLCGKMALAITKLHFDENGNEKEADIDTHEMFKSIMPLAETPQEQMYICYQFGRYCAKLENDAERAAAAESLLKLLTKAVS